MSQPVSWVASLGYGELHHATGRGLDGACILASLCYRLQTGRSSQHLQPVLWLLIWKLYQRCSLSVRVRLLSNSSCYEYSKRLQVLTLLHRGHPYHPKESWNCPFWAHFLRAATMRFVNRLRVALCCHYLNSWVFGSYSWTQPGQNLAGQSCTIRFLVVSWVFCCQCRALCWWQVDFEREFDPDALRLHSNSNLNLLCA